MTSGIAPRTSKADESPLGKIQRAIRSTLPQPIAGSRVVILARPTGALVLELGGNKDLTFQVRAASDDELASAKPARILLQAAPRTGAIGTQNVCTGRLVDDPTRIVVRGASIKCADRPTAPLLAETRFDGSSRARDIRAALQSNLARH